MKYDVLTDLIYSTIAILYCLHKEILVIVNFLQVPFYPPQQKLMDFSSEVSYLVLGFIFSGAVGMVCMCIHV